MQRRTVLTTGAAGAAMAALPCAASAHGAVQDLLRHLDRARAQAERPPLVQSSGLMASAQAQAAQMAGLGQLSHIDAGGRDPARRAQAAGFAGHVVGETLAEIGAPSLRAEIGTPSPRAGQTPLATWLEAAPTRDLLLDPQATHVGAAAHQGRDGRVWYVLALGQHQIHDETQVV